MVLVCNAPEAADDLLARLPQRPYPTERLERIRREAHRSVSLAAESYRAALKDIAGLA